MVERLLIGLLAGGHVLLEGVPGLAKTLGQCPRRDASTRRFQRIQFTPDLLPADVIGTQIFNPQSTGTFTQARADLRQPRPRRRDQPRPGQGAGALLEAMQEKQVTIGDTTFPLPSPSSCSPPEPDRAGGHLPAARGAGRPLHAQARGRLPDPEEERKIIDRMAHAFLQGRGYVTPQDVKAIALDVLRHRVAITYEAEAEGKTSET
jgi:MoxR-like ATPase